MDGHHSVITFDQDVSKKLVLHYGLNVKYNYRMAPGEPPYWDFDIFPINELQYLERLEQDADTGGEQAAVEGDDPPLRDPDQGPER
jgi:hypothetical protein